MMKNSEYIVHPDWNPEVRSALNDFIAMYGRGSEGCSSKEYAVFDFDNSISIFDVEEQCMVYQLRTMAFAMNPEQFEAMLKTDLGDTAKEITLDGKTAGSYDDWIYDIIKAYGYLYENYGPFTAAGLDEKEQIKVRSDVMWSEFAAKLRLLYCAINDTEGTLTAYAWIGYWFTGMTEDEVYSLGKRSHEMYGPVPTSTETWTSPDIVSKTGIRSYTVRYGIAVTENMREVIKALHDNGIDVWICSASPIDVVRAGIDVFGLHDYTTGLIGMTNAMKDGIYLSEYGYDEHPWLTDGDGWIKDMSVSNGAKTQEWGKNIAIDRILVPRYGKGPAAGFMDSTGDYNFCTEYKNLRLTVCFNRADRGAAEGGGIIAELACYMADTLRLDMKKAAAQGDTMYVLQGRNENGMRSFIPCRETVRLNDTEKKLFRNRENYLSLEYMKEHNMTVGSIIDGFAVKGAVDTGFATGFTDKEHFRGYHTR